ncbi:hypothetical protein, partial [Dyadobacter chenhuakuii]
MKRLFALIVMVTIYAHAIGQVSGASARKVDTTYLTLKTQVSELKVSVSELELATKNQFDHLGLQNDFATKALGYFTIFITIIGIGIGVWLEHISKKIKSGVKDANDALELTKKMRSDAEDARKKAEDAKVKAEDFFNRIQNDIDEVYSKIKTSETHSTIKRLRHSPESILYLSSVLMNSDLGNHIVDLMGAYENFKRRPHISDSFNANLHFVELFAYNFSIEVIKNEAVFYEILEYMGFLSNKMPPDQYNGFQEKMLRL